MLQRCFRRLFLFALCSLPLTVFPEPATPAVAPSKSMLMRAAINAVTYEKYAKYTHGNICLFTPDVATEQLDRSILEMLLMCRAFESQGFFLHVEFLPSPNYLRSVRLVEAGIADSIAASVWGTDIDESKVYSTDDIIRHGEFEKGVYVHENSQLLLQSPSTINLSGRVGLTFKTWVYDWNIIGELSPKKASISHMPSMFKMLEMGRADFTLMEFPSEGGLEVVQDGVTLKPIKGVKVSIPSSRKFILSKQSKNGLALFQTLNNGVKTLRLRNEIRQVYDQAGFINSSTQSWKVLNSVEATASVDSAPN